MDRPVLAYDDCGFCTWWAQLFADRTDLRVVGFSDLSTDLLEGAVTFLRQFEEYERLREHGYRFAADQRDLWGQFVSSTPPTQREEADN